jgi:aryl-alcohol dehydrogenase-like predicted oxidoreductase
VNFSRHLTTTTPTTEALIGRWFAQRGVAGEKIVPRQSFFTTDGVDYRNRSLLGVGVRPNQKGPPPGIREARDASLKRPNTDHIDLYRCITGLEQALGGDL